MSKRARPVLDPADPQRRQVLIAAIAGTIVLLVLVGVGIYGLLARPDTTAPTDAPATTQSTVSPTPVRPPGGDLPGLPVTSDPLRYARAVAAAVFTWDTGARFTPLDYTAVVLAGADPSGEESAGLAADVALYLPTSQVWRQLTDYATAQSLTIESAYIPDTWADVLAASDDRIIPGTVAVTIEGSRHRTGTWNDEPVTSEHSVAFTVFVICEPAYSQCHVLRLSELDNPLR
ncbi:hypothetical protein [Candidatus Corynebacterium faecigallinarum]|uniref:hypothetical protein n=1 Tax=Candidatus Corynebacterium faecigallinarum TaxID=2838528 RepID=UPI003FBA7995